MKLATVTACFVFCSHQQIRSSLALTARSFVLKLILRTKHIIAIWREKWCLFEANKVKLHSKIKSVGEDACIMMEWGRDGGLIVV